MAVSTGILKELVVLCIEGQVEKFCDLLHLHKLTDDMGYNMLRLGACCDQLDIVRVLLEHGAKVNLINGPSDTPLHFAAAVGNLEMAELLYDNGANAEARHFSNSTSNKLADEEGSDLLCTCAVSNQIEVARYCLDNGAKVNFGSDFSKNALHIAATKNHSEIVNLLLADGLPIGRNK